MMHRALSVASSAIELTHLCSYHDQPNISFKHVPTNPHGYLVLALNVRTRIQQLDHKTSAQSAP